MRAPAMIATLLALTALASIARASIRGLEVVPAEGAAVELAWLPPGTARDLAAARAIDGWVPTSIDELSRTRLRTGRAFVRFRFAGGESSRMLRIPPCAGRGAALLDGRAIHTADKGPWRIADAAGSFAPGTHEVVVAIDVSAYERRVACGEPFAVGAGTADLAGLAKLAFESPHAARGGGKAALFVPPGHDSTKPAAVLVGLHPWNGSIWTYAAYHELLDRAAARDVVVLLPDGLGNSLYTADAEDEVVRAIDALAKEIAVDPSRVSLFGASMGGAGATTIGLHRPDRFATVTSLFGDSRYDLTTYARGVLGGERGAHLVNALDVADNARWLDVWLVHGEADRTSPIRQSEKLAERLGELGIGCRFDRVPNAGHEGRLVAERAAAIVDRAADRTRPSAPPRVSFRSVRDEDASAYWLRIERRAPGDAFVDAAIEPGEVHVRSIENVRALVLRRGPLGLRDGEALDVRFDGTAHAEVRWEGP